MNVEHDPRLRLSPRQEAANRLRNWKNKRIRDVYDLPNFPQDALEIIRPGFEYPDHDHLTVGAFLTQHAKVAR